MELFSLRSLRPALVGLALAAVCGVGFAQTASDAPPRGEAVAPSRAAVWRSIFARPPAVPPTPEDAVRIALGRDLFSDPRLSGAGHASCATCHDPGRALTDGRKTAVGPGGAVLPRNAPALYNLAWAPMFFWDGRAASLTEQAKVPILAHDELAGDFEIIAQRLSADADMRARFAAAFPTGGVTEGSILDALAAYERS